VVPIVTLPVPPPIGHTLFSPSNRRRFEHWAWVPPTSCGSGPFPLLVLLHGVHDAGGFVWWQKGRAHETLHRLVADGTIPPVVVLMAGDTGAEQGAGYCDWADGTTLVETHLIGELLPWAEETLPVDGTRHIAGLSMGGYGALLLALRNPDTFVSASATSGFFTPDRLFTYVPDAATRMWGSDERRAAHDVRALLVDPRRAHLRFAFDCGTSDHLIDHNRSVHAELAAAGVPHGWAEHPGAHDWPYWRDHLADHLQFHLTGTGPLA
jgi:S-formylglutathione hydrolase FrmB